MLRKLFILVAFMLLSGTGSAQEFVLTKPDTAHLRKLEKQGDYTASLTYLYLQTYYKPVSPKDSVSYFEWDKESICAFRQDFVAGITYKVWNCDEGKGITEELTLPKIPLPALRDFMRELYHDKENTWVTPISYAPEEMGCFYDIVESDQSTTIQIYCGC
jgi:hypothetical protein